MRQSRPRESRSVTVRRPMNEHGAMCVEVGEAHATRHVVDYEDPEIRQTLESLPQGTTLPLEMEPLEDRANVWRAVAIDRSTARTPARAAHSGD